MNLQETFGTAHSMRRAWTFTSFVAAALAIVIATATPAPAQQAQRLGVFESWVAFTYESSRGKVCYIVSQPLDSEPKNVRRGEIYFMITHRPGQNIRNEVMTMIGYNFKTGSEAKIEIGSNTFDMFTNGEGAWVETSENEGRIVTAMRGGAKMTVRGTSWRGTRTVDQYSLIGVTAALEKINETCGS